MGTLRIAVVGHAEHVTVGRVAALPAAGEIAHLEAPRAFAGGGGALAFAQLAKSGAEVHFFTALGDDDAAREVEAQLRATGAHIHAARRPERHTRDVVLALPHGERTIVVVGEPLHPRRDDPLPWELLAGCDAAYFTAQDPQALIAARAARLLLVTARRRPALLRSGVRADVVLGSAVDPREAGALSDYPVRPDALVLTEGPAGGRIETAQGSARFPAPLLAPQGGVAYGAGDSFAGALTYRLAAGATLMESCTRAGAHGAAVLAGLDPWHNQLALPGARGPGPL
jgi:ribokinase